MVSATLLEALFTQHSTGTQPSPYQLQATTGLIHAILQQLLHLHHITNMTFELPEIIARQRASERLRYMRLTPERRAAMLADYERVARKNGQSVVYTALDELRDAHLGNLPCGEYRNDRGDQLVVYPGNWRPTLCERAPIPPNHIWVRIPRWLPPSKLGAEYRFFFGNWVPVSPAPVPPFDAAQQHSQHQLRPGLEGATFRGIRPPMPQQLSTPTPAAYGGQEVNFAAPQQHMVAASPPQQPPADLELSKLSEEAFGEALRSTLLHAITDMGADEAREQSHQATTQLSRNDSAFFEAYAGYAPAKHI
jgi:hypothetical protein